MSHVQLVGMHQPINSVHLKGFVLSLSTPLCLECFFDFLSLEFDEQCLQLHTYSYLKANSHE